ncbi:MAG: DctP family TRAP transporter solute-binding subunit [Oceanospirillaceae bacterium]|jgi:C4-dicarboxylate-binding protein DctP|nr:DctP family TRAP transporter solute-binding subunit [Oceanospirillaceae bacterium]MBT4443347.1 DctP family TRAP transporter solute-binding subunit [Oceanospirillaceae bacterium]MBT7331006.1 DctP family TRAP transporter solute-binding subunit [Oceanospirillaceae bacterium]
MKLYLKTALASAMAAALVATPVQASDVCQDGEIVIKFSHVTNTDKHPKGIAATELAARVNSEMDGKVCLEVYPNSTLYGDGKVLEALLMGDVQMAAPSLSKFEKYTKQFRLFDLPFMFKNIDAIDEFQASTSGQAMKQSMTKRGLLGLEFWHNGLKQLSATKPLLNPADAAGLKFRVQASDVLVAQFKTLGAVPQKMSFSEVYQALQSGTIQGQENTYSNIYGKKFFEVQDSVTESNHGVIDYLVVTSSEFWEGLPNDIRNQLETILREVTVSRNAKAFGVNEANKQAILEAGKTIHILTDAQRAEWKAAMLPVWDQFKDDVGQTNIDAAQAINAQY